MLSHYFWSYTLYQYLKISGHNLFLNSSRFFLWILLSSQNTTSYVAHAHNQRLFLYLQHIIFILTVLSVSWMISLSFALCSLKVECYQICLLYNRILVQLGMYTRKRPCCQGLNRIICIFHKLSAWVVREQILFCRAIQSSCRKHNRKYIR